MNCSGKAKGSSYTPKKMTPAAKSSAVKKSSTMKGWAGSAAFGTPKVGKVSFGRR